MSTIDVRRADNRLTTENQWLESRHSFSFGDHYDPANTHHGFLLVNNDETVAAGTGFDTHPHRDTEIITWVLSGSLVHQDSLGHAGIIYPGLAQRMSAGSGITHSEKNDSWRSGDGLRMTPADDAHFIQMWLMPDESGFAPNYEQAEVADELASGELITIASGMDKYRDTRAIGIRNRQAALHIAQLNSTEIVVPEAAISHVFIARGNVTMEGVGELMPGDAVRLTDSGGQRITGDAEVIVWEMNSAPSW